MWLYSIIQSYARWALSLSKKILLNAPLPIVIVVTGTLVSQLSLLLASVLPLKIILLIGSSGVPRYFPQSFATYDREPLVLGLGVAAIGFYVLHLLAERLIVFCNEQAANRVLARTSKLTLFPNQENIARGAIRKLARSIAATIFCLAALTLFAFVFPAVALALVGWCAAVCIAVAVAGASNSNFQSWLEANASSFIGSTASIGFFIVVATIIIQFLLGIPFHVLYAVISLILSRQVLQRISASLKDALTLSAQKTRINALFFHGHTLVAQTPRHDDDFWSLCRADRLAEWLPQLIGEKTGKSVNSAKLTKWHETGLTDIAFFDVQAMSQEGTELAFRVKLFNRSRRMLAAQEITLLSSVSGGAFPCLPFLGASQVGESDCLLFQQVETMRPRVKDVDAYKRRLLQECWLYEPPTDLVQRYRRSHQLLDQRLLGDMGDRLQYAALTVQAQENLRQFVGAIESIKALLRTVPLFVHGPGLGPGTVEERVDGQLIVTEWGRWTLEPVGAGWPTSKRMLVTIDDWLSKAGAKRGTLARITADQVQLAALAFAFQRHCAQQRFNSALELLPAMLACLKASGESPELSEGSEEEQLWLKMTGT